MNEGKHLNEEGIIKIINLKAPLNKGLSDKLSLYLPNNVKLNRFEVNIPKKIDPN
jgi:hypothetical protein